MKHWALVTAQPQPTGSRLAVVAVVLAVVVGVVAVGGVLSGDPVGYGVPVWPFANAADEAEGRVMASVVTAARADAASLGSLAGVPAAVKAGDVEVLRTQVERGGLAVWLLLRLQVPSVGVRCREVVVLGATPVEVNSRRVDC
ncbi:hypothetical protein ACFFQW_32185 [Umezawaea endophytica]|uniref:Uncharacterized protein n=1 Tax=Umezawaea endophytica TaxID=1654476 RepID=A0A9X3AJP7_9PSEU|nr:hypothetical protein [Umezawaea endophytica]MCS7484336.1 hypothetical protein [Umezawaea endophytica]